jgi:hypothetical protein
MITQLGTLLSYNLGENKEIVDNEFRRDLWLLINLYPLNSVAWIMLDFKIE